MDQMSLSSITNRRGVSQFRYRSGVTKRRSVAQSWTGSVFCDRSGVAVVGGWSRVAVVGGRSSVA